METKTPTTCPSCGGDLVIRSLECPACHTTIDGHYPLSRFLQLPQEQLRFCETFLQCRGNLKDVCTVLEISYPTARNRLDALLDALDFERQTVSTRSARLDILEQLERGDLNAEEAVEKLKGGNTP